MNALIIPADATLPIREYSADSLEAMQAAVGGCIEAVPLVACGLACEGYVNEEGKLIGLRVNPRATFLYPYATDVLCGDVLVMGPLDSAGEHLPLDEERVTAILALLRPGAYWPETGAPADQWDCPRCGGTGTKGDRWATPAAEIVCRACAGAIAQEGPR